MALGTDYNLQEVMNSLRTEMSPQYQDRIPELSDDNFREVANGLSVPTFFNEWFNTLINRIGLTVLKTRAWSNPLAPLKKGTLEMGESIQEIFVDLIEAKTWKSYTTETDAGKVYKTEKPDVYSAYFPINRTDVYEVSYNEVDINRAFISPQTLERFIGDLYERLHTSDQVDEYFYMRELLKTYDEKGLYHYVEVPDIENLDLDMFVTQVKAMSTKFTFMKDNFTGLQVPQHAPRDEQYIFIDADLDALLDVNVLANAFNMGKKEFLARKIVLDEMPVEDALLILASADWLNVYESLREIRTLANPQTLEMKLFYHIHQVHYTSLFENAVAFTTKKYNAPATVALTGDNVSGTQVTATKGQWLTLVPEVKGTDGKTANVNQAVIYKFDDDKDRQTHIEGNRLYVALTQEDDFGLIVSATHDKSVFKEYTIKVSE